MTTLSHSSPFAALRHNNFRLFIGGQGISLAGTWMQRVAQGWLVFALTDSELWLGLVATAMGFPMFFLTPLGGVISDRVPRRRILVSAQITQALLAFILATLTFADLIQVWHILILAFCFGVVTAIEMPARQVIIADIIKGDDLQSGLALGGMTYDVANIIGPTVAGVMLVQFGAAWCFLLDGLSFGLNCALLLAMSVIPFVQKERQQRPWQELREGLHYARTHRRIAPVLLLDVAVALFGINVIAVLMPAFADVQLGSPKVGYAVISAMLGLGAIVAGLLSVWLSKRFGRGRVVFVMTIILPILMAIFAFSQTVLMAAIFMAFLGFGFATFFVTSNALIQTEVEDSFRGRVMALYMLALWGFPLMTTLAFGLVAEVIGTANTFAASALILLIVALGVYWKSDYLEARHDAATPDSTDPAAHC